jgi:integrase
LKGHYAIAIRRAIAKANRQREAEGLAPIPHWHPHQLRHNAATLIRREAGLDAARAVLGHRSPAVTEVYAELDQAKAVAVAAKLG